MGNDVKMEKFLTREDLPGFLRELADALEDESETEIISSINNFKKFKLSVRDDFGQVSLKLKVKPIETPGSGNAGETPGKDGMKPKYSALKKRMKSSFKLIYKMIHEGRTPPQEALDSFISDSHLMCTYPGYGDEYYQDYIAATNGFEEACASGDLEQMKAAVAELASQKGRCHAKYD